MAKGSAQPVTTPERLSPEQLMTAIPVGVDHHETDMLHVPALSDGQRYITPFRALNYGNPPFPHIYPGELHALETTHVRLREQVAGTGKYEHDRLGEHLNSALREIQQRFPASDMIERLKEISEEYAAAELKRRIQVARNMSRVVAGKTLFICAQDPRDSDAGFFAARLLRIKSVINGGTPHYEPLVTTPSGEGLLPAGLYIFGGIYVPALDQQSPKQEAA